MVLPTVSVAMVTYNQAKYIRAAIEGVLQQEADFGVELVIGEDCSSDGTADIVQEYAANYPRVIRVITSERNVGMKANGLRTIAACRGTYLAFCEGDDRWHNSHKIQKQVRHLERHPECGLVYSSYDVYHVAEQRTIKDFIRHRGWDMPATLTIEDLLESKNGRSRGLTTCTVMARRQLCQELIEADPYLHQNVEFPMGDTQLWAELSTRAELHFLSESLATHNIIEGSATRNRDPVRALRFNIAGAKSQLYLCRKYDLPDHISKQYEDYLSNCLLRLACHTRDAELAEQLRQARSRHFSARDWLRYLGARHAGVHHAYRASSALLTLFRPRYPNWV